ncbi:MAG: MipA/OmpV family protein [Paucibacter sp.]|nr:MipA/OmpV family protein [Roseateles sp.]
MAAGTLLLIDAPPAQTTLSLGGTTRAWPTAPGASQEDRILLPALDYTTPAGFFTSTDDGIGWNLAPQFMDTQGVKEWQWGARLWPQWGRPRRLTPPATDRSGTQVLGELFANVQALPFLLLQSGLSGGSGRHHNGTQLEMGATTGVPIGDDLIGISLAASYANAAQLRHGFGVSPASAARGGPRAWQPSRGWQDWSEAVSWEHKFSADWSVSGQWLGARLLGAAAGSPLTQTRFQPSFTLSLWRRL